ncbi:hypothetical protein KJ068_24115 [bacterium]|nr:MAG: hypothetical protein EDS67_00105 [candidate division KSB1 bacterium]MCE7940224.1 hypothetical protein [Chlorobi bacterium CHB1]MCL4708256.1 hypothetical protein [bacterium]MDL1875842.1 hypothetical protein [Cytophagia bacterium CHB2]MBC6951357.1 hypothetical protein [candidate division KSB1 bacterium]
MNDHEHNMTYDLMPNRCAWCDRVIGPEEEVFGCGAKAMPGIDLSDREGKILPLFLALSRKTVPAIVVPMDSQAKKEGNDLYFVICSESCGQALKQALQMDKDAFGTICLN